MTDHLRQLQSPTCFAKTAIGSGWRLEPQEERLTRTEKPQCKRRWEGSDPGQAAGYLAG